jgi:hypothetical protein
VRLAAICSSQFRPFIKSVHFAHDWKRRVTQKIKATNPDYSAIRDIKFEAHLEMLDSTYTFKKVLQQVNNLETFIFSLMKADKDNCRCDLCRLPRLSDRSWWDMDVERFLVETILSNIKSDCLSELVFANTILSYKTLKGLLERHRGTIRKLSIRGCELTGGTWIDLLPVDLLQPLFSRTSGLAESAGIEMATHFEQVRSLGHDVENSVHNHWKEEHRHLHCDLER